jgi:hypothetical protein
MDRVLVDAIREKICAASILIREPCWVRRSGEGTRIIEGGYIGA